jgi:hypothetical protein
MASQRNSLADMLMVEAQALTELRIERAAGRERRAVEADLGPVKISRHPPQRCQRGGLAVVHPRRGAAARPDRGAVALGSDADTAVDAKAQACVQEGRRARQACWGCHPMPRVGKTLGEAPGGLLRRLSSTLRVAIVGAVPLWPPKVAGSRSGPRLSVQRDALSRHRRLEAPCRSTRLYR